MLGVKSPARGRRPEYGGLDRGVGVAGETITDPEVWVFGHFPLGKGLIARH